jgi:hypothetical protein
MPVRINDALRDAMRASIPMIVSVSIYTGTQPTSANNAPTGTLLAQIDGVYLTAGSSAGQVVLDTAMGPYQATAAAAGTAGWARITDGSNTIDTNVAATGAPMNLSSTSIAAGDLVVINSLTITVPAG